LHHVALVSLHPFGLEPRADAQGCGLRVVRESLERRPLLRQQRRMGILAEERVLLRPELLEIGHPDVATRSRISLFPGRAQSVRLGGCARMRGPRRKKEMPGRSETSR